MRLLDAVPLFASLTEEEKEALAATMTRKTYRKGEVLVEQGAKLNSLMVIRNGVVVVSRHEQGREIELSRLAPGDYFGEDGLFTGAGETGTVPGADLRRRLRSRPGRRWPSSCRTGRASPTRSA